MNDPFSSTLFESAADRDAVASAVAAAASAPVADRADAAMLSTLDEPLHAPMFALLSTLADNKYMLGRRYAEWCTGAPMLEAAVAAAAMAQDELGHARSFYPLLRGFPQGQHLQPMEERGWRDRPTSALACLDRPFGSWDAFIAANLVVDAAVTVLLEAAVDTPYEPLRQRARKIVQEEATHWQHARAWTHRLGVAAMTPEILRIRDDALSWYGQASDPVVGPLRAAGFLTADPDTLRLHLLDRLAPHSGSVLDGTAVLPWHRWDPRARRLAP